MPQTPEGPSCQSCGMPMQKPADFGTLASGFRVNDYCRFCFQNGSFTEPGISLEQMVERSSSVLAAKQGLPLEHARAVTEASLPSLKRWRRFAPPHKKVA